MKNEELMNIPFILLDENTLIKVNTALNFSDLKSKFIDRLANIFVDLTLGSLTPSTFYQTDLSNFVRIFEDVKGPCKLISLDIYDNKPNVSSLIGQKQLYESSFSDKKNPTRGYIIVQPSKNGISTRVYRELRENFANLDVTISLLENRENGAIIRGILSFNEL
jgi:hypothetical protein